MTVFLALTKVIKARAERTRAAEQFNAAVIEAHELGHSYREIGEVAGLHHTAIYKIVRKGK